MAVNTKFEGEQVVKTVDKEGSEVSSVSGNVLTIQKWGERFEGKAPNRVSLGIFEAKGTTTIMTREHIDNAKAVLPEVGGFNTEDLLLMCNQTQREDLINSLAAKIRGDASGLSPEEKQAKALVKVLKTLDADQAKKMVKACPAGLKDALTVLCEADDDLAALVA